MYFINFIFNNTSLNENFKESVIVIFDHHNVSSIIVFVISIIKLKQNNA